MAQNYEKLEVMERNITGTVGVKKLRREGKVPAVIYYKGKDNINLSIDEKLLWMALRSGQHIFEIELNGKTQYVMIKDAQFHPVSDEIIHIDLMRVRRDVKTTISVPLILEGIPIGVKEGGVMMQNLNSIDVSCLPGNVPDQITVDVTELEVNSSLAVSDITVPEGIEIITDDEIIIVGIQPPKVMVEAVVEEEVPEALEFEAEAERAEEEKAEGKAKESGETSKESS